jgi:hypothetical protein
MERINIVVCLLKFGIAEPENRAIAMPMALQTRDRRNRHKRSNRETVGGGVLC